MLNPIGAFLPGLLTKPRRKERTLADSDAIMEIIDECLIAHVAFSTASGVPQCLPMAFGRRGGTIYLHGAIANAHLGAVTGQQCSLTFTLIDGLVFARSAFHHSMNYRCAVAIGETRLVTEEDEKRLALTAILEHAAPGRSAECIGVTDAELRATKVVAVDVREAVAKRRQGPPVDEPKDVEAGDVFAGVVELTQHATAVTRDPSMKRALPLPPSITKFALAHGGPQPYELARDRLVMSADPSRLDLDWVHRVLSEQSYWAKGVPRERLCESLGNSLVFGVYAEERQLAFTRVVTDATRIAYVGDVFVDEGQRGQGLGTQLVEFVLSHPTVQACERVILATRDAQNFYAKFGFVPAQHQYMVRRNAG